MSGTQVPANSYAESSYSITVPSTCKVRTSQKPVCRMQTEEHRISPARDHFQISNTSHATVATRATVATGAVVLVVAVAQWRLHVLDDGFCGTVSGRWDRYSV